ncbi:MAG: hypothetical protein M3068_04640 [Gemmatimonadota bacterium]|nr:hypothetical protein [Gemmatimonadota bacterium]
MGTPRAIAIVDRQSRVRMWLGIVLLGAGLLGHLLAAQAIGGSYVAYRDHIFGFVLLSLVSGAIIAWLSRRFWRGRHDISVLTLGILQALLGLVVYVERFRVHG